MPYAVGSAGFGIQVSPPTVSPATPYSMRTRSPTTTSMRSSTPSSKSASTAFCPTGGAIRGLFDPRQEVWGDAYLHAPQVVLRPGQLCPSRQNRYHAETAQGQGPASRRRRVLRGGDESCAQRRDSQQGREAQAGPAFSRREENRLAALEPSPPLARGPLRYGQAHPRPR